MQLLLCLVCIPLWAGIRVNGLKPSYDSVWNMYLYALPERCFQGDSCRLTIKLDSVQPNTVYLVDAEVVKGDSLTLNLTPAKVMTGYRLLSVTADTLLIDRLMFTSLPIVQLEGDFGYDYLQGRFGLQDADSLTAGRLLAKIKWRGGSTNTEGRHKRNYHVKFLADTLGGEQEVNFPGFRSSDSWILDAAQVDLSRIRNRTCTDLWNDFARKPYYAAKEPEARSGARGRFVELFLNHRYMGVYSLGEAIDRKQLKLKKYKQQEIRGQLWKTKSWTSDVTMHSVPDYDDEQESMGGYETKYPKLDKAFPTDYSVIHDAIRLVAESNDSVFEARVGDCFDLPVLTDYYVFLQTVYAIDNCGKNMYWACYDKTVSPKLTPAVWDLDATIGGNVDCSEIRTEPLAPCNDFMDRFGYLNLLRRLYQGNLCGFRDAVKERFWQLREGPLHTDSLVARFMGNIEKLQLCGAAGREERRWSGDSDICYRELCLHDEAAYMADWIKRHMQFLDEEVFNRNASAVHSVKRDAAHRDKVFDLFGRPVDTTRMSPGLYIRNGRLYRKK